MRKKCSVAAKGRCYANVPRTAKRYASGSVGSGIWRLGRGYSMRCLELAPFEQILEGWLPVALCRKKITAGMPISVLGGAMAGHFRTCKT